MQVILRKMKQYGSGQIMKYLLLPFALALVVALIHETQAQDHDCCRNSTLCEPEQIHIAFGEKVNDITVTWSTIKDTTHSIVQYGERKLDNKVNGEHKLFADGGIEKRSQWIHNVRLKELKFNTSYVYKVGSEFGWSEQFSFKTPPAGEDWPVNVVIFGDLGVDNGVSLPFIEEDLTSSHYDFVIHVGDFAYNMDTYNGEKGDKFMNGIQPIAANYPYMVCPGNHETAYNYSHYKTRFSMPGHSDSMFYSFDIGPIHFIALNTEAYFNNTNYSPPAFADDNGEMATQYHWLENDLKEANKPENRRKRPWIITYGHRPFYCSNNEDYCDKMDYFHRVGVPVLGGYGLEPLLKDYTVDLEIWAHEHSYERMWPVYNKTVYNGSYEHPYVNPGAPVHFTSGSAGCNEKVTLFDKPLPWTAFQSSDYGYTRFTAHNKTRLYIEQISVLEVKGIGSLPKKIDEFWLIKNHRNPYNL